MAAVVVRAAVGTNRQKPKIARGGGTSAKFRQSALGNLAGETADFVFLGSWRRIWLAWRRNLRANLPVDISSAISTGMPKRGSMEARETTAFKNIVILSD